MSQPPDPSAILSPREYEVLCALGRLGHSKAVASCLGISPRTVEHHLASARQKLGVETTLQAMRLVDGVAVNVPGPNRRAVRWGAMAAIATMGVGAAWLVARSAGRESMPELGGLGLAAAVELLESKGLRPVTVYRDVATPKGKPARQHIVHSTEPRAGDRLFAGSTVRLVVSTGWFQGEYFQDLGRLGFEELFETRALSEQWSVASGKGRISLTDVPGSLSYTLTESTERGTNPRPARAHIPFSGSHWALEFKVAYDVPRGSGRQHMFAVVFGKDPYARSSSLVWERSTDAANVRCPEAVSATFARAEERAMALLPNPYADGKFYVRIVRRGSKLTVRHSNDGEYFQEFFETTATHDLGNLQWVVLYGTLFDRDGGRASYDFVRVTPIDPSLP